MEDPYLYGDVDILKNLADIKDRDLLSRASTRVYEREIDFWIELR